jgi:hypothetical protein
VGVVAAKYRGRFQAELPTPQTSCACPNGIVARADEWSVEFVRGYQDVGRALLRPASSAYGVISLRPQIAPGDTVPVGPSRFIPDAIAFEWAEESPACRRLAFTMLALVTSTTVADRWAEAYMRDVLAKQLAKQFVENAANHGRGDSGVVWRAHEAAIKGGRRARPIYANEHFKVHQGTKKLIEHHVESSIRLRGELVGGYAWAETSRRDLVIVTLDRADIDQIRIDHSEDWADGELDDIARWYVPKTCIHQLRREIGLPDDYIAKYADDFSRAAPSPAPTVILSEATAFPVDPRAPKAAA